MKSLVRALIGILVISVTLLFAIDYLNKAEGYASGNTLTIFNWGDYIDPELIAQFEDETGIKVIYQTFDSNEAMMTKIEQGGTTYDIAVPSDYTIAKMIDDDLLIPLDYSKIVGIENIDNRFLDISFDPNNVYSIPYFWGTVGIVYNPEMLDGLEITSWHDLWNEDLENQIFLADGAREVVGMALNSIGYSLNSTDGAELAAASGKLQSLMPNVKAILGDEIKMLLANEEAAVGLVWSGDAAEIMYENEALTYVIPDEGTNLWSDNLVIPKTAKNIDAAYEFINFMLRPEVAAQNADYVGYSTPNAAALELMDPEVTEDERFYPSTEVTDELEYYTNIGKANLAKYNDIFLEFKMSGQ
ncbi:MAG: ABC transporter substrate-binding protein [Culicoidibacterales bacterium]